MPKLKEIETNRVTLRGPTGSKLLQEEYCTRYYPALVLEGDFINLVVSDTLNQLQQERTATHTGVVTRFLDRETGEAKYTIEIDLVKMYVIVD